MPRFIPRTKPRALLRLSVITVLILVFLLELFLRHGALFTGTSYFNNIYSYNFLDYHHSQSPQPTSTLCRQGVPPVHTALDAVDLLRDNLEPDFAAWGNEPFTIDNVLATADVFKDQRDVVILVRIQNNTIEFPLFNNSCGAECNPMMHQIRDAFEAGFASNKLSLPDTTFLLNVFDDAICRKSDGNELCSAPVFCINRRQEFYRDILVPSFNLPFEAHDVPWEQKRPLAFFRGTPFCNEVEHYIAGRMVNCSRLILSDMSRAHPDLLNISIVEDFDYQGRVWKALEGPFTSVEEHAEYQMLVNLDGYAASTRLSMLLATNSVVLKQESVFEEHYYRSLRPCVHYLPIWDTREEDILEVVRAVRAEPWTAQAIAANAQAFAFAHLTDEAKYRYWEQALTRYADLMHKWEGKNL